MLPAQQCHKDSDPLSNEDGGGAGDVGRGHAGARHAEVRAADAQPQHLRSMPFCGCELSCSRSKLLRRFTVKCICRAKLLC